MNENNTEEIQGGTPDQQTEQPDVQGAHTEVKLTGKQKWKKFLLELADMLKGAAFPFIVMCVLSSLIILFASYTESDLVIQLIAIIGGEGILIAALVSFARSNGASAYKTMASNQTKRTLKNPDEKILFRTGEYAPWKGFVIGFITVIPYIIFVIIACTGDYSFVEFMLQYAFGWAAEPLLLIGGVPAPYYFIMIIFPIGIMGGLYIQGRYSEEKRQQNITRAEDDQRKGKKKK